MTVTKQDVEKANADFADWQQNRGDKAEYAGSTRDPGVIGFRYTSGRGLPWHGRGDSYEQDATPEQIVAQSFPWGDSVKKRPLYIRSSAKSGAKRVAVPDRYATVRTDNDTVLGIVGKTYVVQPISDFVEAMYSIIDLNRDVAAIDTAGALKGGRIPFISIALDGLDLTIAGEKYEGFLLGTTSFDGSRAMQLSPVVLRPQCANSVNMAPAGIPSLGIPPSPTTFRMKHTALLSSRVAAARQALQIGYEFGAAWKAVGDKLATKKLVDKQIEAIFEKAFPMGGEPSDAQKERSVAFAMLRDWRESDNLEPIRETAWGAFQAGVEWIDHGRNYGKRGDAGDARAYSLMYGDGAQMKTRLLKAVAASVK
jgi:phage/plasmid-like protein (TIGR03299 family)